MAPGPCLEPALEPMQLRGPHSCYGERMHKHVLPKKRPLLKFDYIILGLGKGQVVFQTNQSISQSFMGLCWPLLQPIPFLLLGFCVPYPIWSFSQARHSPFWSSSWPLLFRPHSGRSFPCTILISTGYAPSREISPLLSILPSHSLGEWTSCATGRLESWSFLPMWWG